MIQQVVALLAEVTLRLEFEILRKVVKTDTRIITLDCRRKILSYSGICLLCSHGESVLMGKYAEDS